LGYIPNQNFLAAFAYPFEEMERYGWPQWNGVPKNALEIGEMSLNVHFAPDHEVPSNPIENYFASNRRVAESSPETTADVRRLFKASPEGWGRLLEISGISKDVREMLAKAMREK
jgi:hypothetical protein